MHDKIRTDLALEIKESFEEDNIEVRGVAVEEKLFEKGSIKVTKVKIINEAGSKAMNKPIGTYITIEAEQMKNKDEDYHSSVSKVIGRELKELRAGSNKRSENAEGILVLGLGNREVTPDALGPYVVDNLFITRHLIKEFKDRLSSVNKLTKVSAIAPGVMAQTGMEANEIVKGIVGQVKPSLVIVIDALAARSIKRLNTTIQLTDTGISPGAGIGNNRQELNKESLGVDVIALGVPTVVAAGTIVRDRMEEVLQKQDFSESEIELFLKEVEQNSVENMFVTPKDVDEAVKSISYTISEAINGCFN